MAEAATKDMMLSAFRDLSYSDVGVIAAVLAICAIAAAFFTFVYFLLVTRRKDPLRRPHANRVALLLYLLGALAVLFAFYYSACGTGHLSIVEFCRKYDVPEGDLIDEDASYAVIRNNGALAVKLSGMYLSETEDDLFKFRIPDCEIAPGDMIKVLMSGKESLDIKKEGGSSVFLSDRKGVVVDSLQIPALKRNEYVSVLEGTPKVDSLQVKTIDPPLFSADGGFYEKEFELELTGGNDCEIYYTTDGSLPDKTSARYEGPVRIYNRSGEENVYRNIRNVVADPDDFFEGNVPCVDKAFIIRAICIDGEGHKSPVITNTYFVGLDHYKGIDVISLVADPDDLFGDNGIYANGKEYDSRNDDDDLSDDDEEVRPNWEKKGFEWERKADITLFSKGVPILEQPVGIRIQGHGSRENPLKRFSVFSRKKYSGSRYFDYPVLGSDMTHAFTLRPGDFHALMQELGKDRDVLTTPVRHVSVFLDGEFWYGAYMIEKPQIEYIADRYNVSEYNIAIVKNQEFDADTNKGSNPFFGIFDCIEDDTLSSEEKYYSISEMIDIQSFIDSTCIHVYVADLDYKEQWNNFFWHSIDREDDNYGDTRWRLGLIDMDNYGSGLRDEFAQEAPKKYMIDPFRMYSRYQDSPVTKWNIFSTLRNNNEFCKRFVLTFMDISNTVFSTENVNENLEGLGIANEEIWEFFEHRKEYVIPFVAGEFGLSGNIGDVTISSSREGAIFKINTTPLILEDRSWTGQYFTDYPVTVTTDDEGFDHWEITSGQEMTVIKDRKIEIPVQEDGVSVYAVFE